MGNEELIEKVKSTLLCMQRFSWEQGIAAQAFLELGETDLVIRMAYAAALRQGDDGRLALMDPDEAVTDPASNGEPMLFAARVTGDESLKRAVERNVDYLLHRAPKNKNGITYHWPDKKIVMVDSCYMAPPLLAVTGHLDEAIKQIDGFRKLLWDKGKKLFHHAWNDEKMDFERKLFWGVGNGWAAAGITRVLRAIPESRPDEKRKLEGYIRELVESCIGYMRPDGLFHDILDDASTFVDANTGQTLAYSIFRGVGGGWIDKSFLGAANMMREAAHKKVDKWGIVRDVCGAPTFQSQGMAPEAQAFFLLMEAAYRDLVG
ncbi:MAG: glycoside hydrolase family 88 protein [Rectinemataceae bacterium]